MTLDGRGVESEERTTPIRMDPPANIIFGAGGEGYGTEPFMCFVDQKVGLEVTSV
jgi:hypothetical protein